MIDSANIATVIWEDFNGVDTSIRASRALIAPPAAPVPTLAGWALILLGLMLAAGGAWGLSRPNASRGALKPG